MNTIKLSSQKITLLNKNFINFQFRTFNKLTKLNTIQSEAPLPPNYSNSELLERALERVPQLGFTSQAIERTCLSLDYPELPQQFQQNGAHQLINHYLVTRRLKTLETVKQIKEGSEVKKLRKQDLIRLCFEKRLELSKPVIGKWGEAVALLSASREGIKLATLELYNLIDDFLFISGDKSADMSWYYKRLIYSKIFAASEIYMTEDKSPEFLETFKFLNSQFDDIKNVKEGLNDASNLLKFFTKNLIGVINSKGRNIL